MSKKRIKINVMTITVRELREKLSQLPVIIVGTVVKDNQIIEGNRGGAHYEITKEESPKFPGCACYAIKISSPSEDSCLSIISKFIELLDEPLMRFPSKVFPNTVFLYYDAKEISKEAVS